MFRLPLIALLVLGWLTAAGVQAQGAYPAKPVKLVVPFLPGGAPDVVARVVAQELSTRLGQQFIVENRAGAGGNVAADYIAKSAPDGYALLAASEAPLVMNPHVYKSLPYDPVNDFSPVILIAQSAFYVVACPKLPIATMSDLVALAKRQRLSYASSGHGTNMNMNGETVKVQAGIDMTHVPYKGAPPAMADVMSCNVDIGFGAFGTVLPLIKGGRLKALAVSTAARAPETPEVPTLAESGFPELSRQEAYYGFLAPARTPAPIIDLLNREVREILKMPAIIEGFRARGLTVISGSPKDFAERLANDYKKYGKIVKDARIRTE